MKIADVIGQPGAVRLLRRLVVRDRLPTASLLSGPPGCGRRTLARAVAQALLCSAAVAGDACGICEDCQWCAAGIHPDLVALPGDRDPVPDDLLALYANEEGRPAGAEITAGALIPAAWTRLAVAAAASESSLRGRGRVFILPAIERLNGSAANALLKVLEEPPPGCRFLMTCDQPNGVLPTIRSRSQLYRLQPLDAAAVEAILIAGGMAAPLARLRAASAAGSHRACWEDAEPGPIDALIALIDAGLTQAHVATIIEQLPGKGEGAGGERRQILRRWLHAASDRLRARLRDDQPQPAIAGLAAIAQAGRLLDRNQDPRLVVEALALAN